MCAGVPDIIIFDLFDLLTYTMIKQSACTEHTTL